MTRVAIVASSSAAGRSLRAMLQASGIDVVGQFSTVSGAASIDDVDVFVLGDAALLGDALDAERPSVNALVALVDELDEARVEDLKDLRGWAIVPRDAGGEELRAAIAAAHAGLAALPASWERLGPTDGLGPTGDRATAPEDEGLVESLTPREHDVLELLSLGLSNRRIGDRLGISEHTVKFHVAAIYGKLAVSSRTAAVNRALRLGILKI